MIHVQEVPTYRGGTEIRVHDDQWLIAKARFAADITIKMALCAVQPDGEDSAGRQKGRLMDADALASRACDITEALWKEFERREWIESIPTPKPEQPHDSTVAAQARSIARAAGVDITKH